MTSDKGPSILWADFQRLVPNGTWVQQVSGSTLTGVPLPAEGIVMMAHADNVKARALDAWSPLTVQTVGAVDPVPLYAGFVIFTLGDETIDFEELCIRATEQRLAEAGVSVDAHPLQWMTHPTELGVSVEQIGTMLYETATWIEQSGNRGYAAEDLMIALPGLKIRLLRTAYRMAWADILFFGEGGKKRDFSGWGVHKRTPAHWSVTWLARFGAGHPLAEAHMAALWDEALDEYDKRSLKRTHQVYAGVELETADTWEIARLAAATWLMSRWAHHRAWHHGPARDLWQLQGRLSLAASEVFQHELLYRLDRPPQPRRSKKKTQAAREDWATASRYIVAGGGFDAYRFYTPAYVQACCDSDTTPDTHVTMSALPRDEVTEGASEREVQG